MTIFEEEPVSCKKMMWKITSNNKRKGKIKCNVKNILKVGCLTEKFPHNQRTRE